MWVTEKWGPNLTQLTVPQDSGQCSESPRTLLISMDPDPHEPWRWFWLVVLVRFQALSAHMAQLQRAQGSKTFPGVRTRLIHALSIIEQTRLTYTLAAHGRCNSYILSASCTLQDLHTQAADIAHTHTVPTLCTGRLHKAPEGASAASLKVRVSPFKSTIQRLRT